MAAPIRKAPAAQPQRVSFLRLEDFSEGGFLPDGIYLWRDAQWKMHQYTKKDGTPVGAPFLDCQIIMEPQGGATKEEEKKYVHYSAGKNAHLTYQPDPATKGKTLILVPGGPASPMYEGSNFQMLVKSLHDTVTFPDDFGGDDLGFVDGLVARMQGILEPESRTEYKRSQNALAEVAQAPSAPKKIPVVAEVISAPWQSNGNAPVGEKVTLTKADVGKLPPPPKATSVPAPQSDDIDIPSKIAGMLEANPNGLAKASLRMGVFKDIKTHPSGQALMDQYFGSDDTLNTLLNEWGYKIEGDRVVLIP
ncbi:MAG TPA: hypothetical protein VNZ86_06640 [Bacteroidia bacterium]|jgi:hypothetical protein|nr:hypothetical protein [Bacteroidia bacterium]